MLDNYTASPLKSSVANRSFYCRVARKTLKNGCIVEVFPYHPTTKILDNQLMLPGVKQYSKRGSWIHHGFGSPRFNVCSNTKSPSRYLQFVHYWIHCCNKGNSLLISICFHLCCSITYPHYNEQLLNLTVCTHETTEITILLNCTLLFP